MAPLRLLPTVLVVVALSLGGGCDRKAPPQPPDEGSASKGIELRYAALEQPVQQDLELQLTQTQLGLYIEADLAARAELRLSPQGGGLRASWSVVDVSNLAITGTIEPGDVDQVRTLLTDRGKGTTIATTNGLLDAHATDADPVNTARTGALSGADAPPVAGALLMTALAEQVRLPLVPSMALAPGETVEIAEESETVVTDAQLVMPTTTVHRFTLRKIDQIEGSRVAELDLLIASVAQPELDPEADPDEADAEPVAELRSEAEGTLVFDVDRNLPVSLELSGTETLRVGDQEVERNIQLRTTFAAG